MDIILDASAILAILLDEPERCTIMAATKGKGLVAPASLEHEIGNALSAMLKRRSLTVADTVAVYHGFAKVPIRLVEVHIPSSLLAAGSLNIYAYDAYFIDCAERLNLPLLTLDKKLAEIAKARGIKLVEV